MRSNIKSLKLQGISMGRLDWAPVRYANRAFSPNLLAAIYRKGKVGLVTPLHDGVILVAKEYVAAQDPEDPGVHVRSRFADAIGRTVSIRRIRKERYEMMATIT